MNKTMPGAQDFQPFIGATLAVAGGPDLLLAQVDVRRAGFILLLQGPAEPVLAEGIHTLTVPGGSSWELYMMPVQTMGRDRQDYQVVCN